MDKFTSFVKIRKTFFMKKKGNIFGEVKLTEKKRTRCKIISIYNVSLWNLRTSFFRVVPKILTISSETKLKEKGKN